jgi:uncharacterized UBP type Zn finger protein
MIINIDVNIVGRYWVFNRIKIILVGNRSLQNAERHIILRTAPEYLILSLNRFEYDKTTNIFRKIFTKINYPKVLHVSIYPSRNLILTKYCLVLVIVHTGYTLHDGHYYVYARELKPSLSNRIAMVFRKVGKVSEILNIFLIFADLDIYFLSVFVTNSEHF